METNSKHLGIIVILKGNPLILDRWCRALAHRAKRQKKKIDAKCNLFEFFLLLFWVFPTFWDLFHFWGWWGEGRLIFTQLSNCYISLRAIWQIGYTKSPFTSTNFFFKSIFSECFSPQNWLLVIPTKLFAINFFFFTLKVWKYNKIYDYDRDNIAKYLNSKIDAGKNMQIFFFPYFLKIEFTFERTSIETRMKNIFFWEYLFCTNWGQIII